MSSDDSEAFKRFFQAAAEGGWKLLQYYMCGPKSFRANQRGNGLGGVHCAHNSHKVVPLNAFDGIAQRGNGQLNPTTASSEPPVVIKMVTPAQQTAEQANSNLKRKADDIKDLRLESPRHSRSKCGKVKKQADKYDNLPLFNNV